MVFFSPTSHYQILRRCVSGCNGYRPRAGLVRTAAVNALCSMNGTRDPAPVTGGTPKLLYATHYFLSVFTINFFKRFIAQRQAIQGPVIVKQVLLVKMLISCLEYAEGDPVHIA